MEWQLADAKNRFSELVNRALSEGPQIVSRRGDSVVVIERGQYEKLTGVREDFKRFLMRKGPYLDGVEIERDRSPMRDVPL